MIGNAQLASARLSFWNHYKSETMDTDWLEEIDSRMAVTQLSTHSRRTSTHTQTEREREREREKVSQRSAITRGLMAVVVL